MLSILGRFLAFHGFTHGLCGRYELIFLADGTIAVRRKYRFRWQMMATLGEGVPRRKRYLWSSKLKLGKKKEFQIARLPDAGQIGDAISIANARAAEVYDRNKVSDRTAIVADMALEEIDIPTPDPLID